MEEELSQNTKFSISILTKFTEAACIPQLKGSSILELFVHGSLQLEYGNYFISCASPRNCNNILPLTTR